MTTTEDSGSGNGVSTGGHGVGNGGGGVIIMENLIEKSLYDIGDPDLMDVWDTDLNAVRKAGKKDERASAKFSHEFEKNDGTTTRC